MAFIFWLFFGLAVAYGLQWLAWDKQRASNDARKAATSLGLPRSRLQNYVRLTQKRPAEDLKKKVAKSEELERAVWSLVEYIIRDYIEWWYNKISRDNDFTNDVRHMFEHVLSQIVDGLKKVQWETVIENLMVEMRKLLKSYRVTEDNLIKNVQGFKGQSFAERQAQIMERIYSNYEVHVAVVGSHRVYLRKISGTLLKTLLKGKDNECNTFQALVREVLACKVLEPVMGYAHPFYINTAIIAGTKPGNDGSQSNSPRASEGDLERMGARSSATRSSVHSERDGTGAGSDAKVESGQVDEEGSVPKLQPGGSQSLPVGGAAARPRDAASITSAQSDSKVASAKHGHRRHRSATVRKRVQDIEERLDRWREHKQKELLGGDRRSKGAVLPPFDTPRHMSSTRAERSASNISDSGLGSPARPFTPTTPRPRDDDDDTPERRSRSSSFWATEGDDGVRVVRAAMQYRGRRPTMSPQKGAGSVVLKIQHAHIVESPKPHVRYQLVCQNGKIKWIVEKRYKQFLELHKLLKKSCVDASAADKLSELFPKKTMFTSSLSKKVIAKRKGQLQEYLALCCKMPSVYLSNEFRAFVIPDEKGDGKEDQKDKGHRKKLTAHLYGMVDEVFQLTRHGWVRKQVIWTAKQLLGLFFDSTIYRKVETTIYQYTSEQAVIEGIKGLVDMMWPGGVLYYELDTYEDWTPPTDDDMKKTSEEALDMLLATIRSSVPLLGRDYCVKGATKFHEFLQADAVVGHLGYFILDQILTSVVPSIKAEVEKIHVNVGTYIKRKRAKSKRSAQRFAEEEEYERVAARAAKV